MTDTLEQILAKRRDCQARIDAIREEMPDMPQERIGYSKRVVMSDCGSMSLDMCDESGCAWRSVATFSAGELEKLAAFLAPLFPKEPQKPLTINGGMICVECDQEIPADHTAQLCRSCNHATHIACAEKHAEHCK